MQNYVYFIIINNMFVKPTGLTKEQAAYTSACLAIGGGGEEGGIQSLLIHEANGGPGPAALSCSCKKTLADRAFCTIPDTCQTSTKAILLEFGTESVVHQGPFCFNDDCCHSFDTVIFFYPPVPNALQESCCSLKRGGKVVILR